MNNQPINIALRSKIFAYYGVLPPPGEKNQPIKVKNKDGSTLTLEVPEINHRLQNRTLSYEICAQGEHMLTFLPLRFKIFKKYGVLPPPREKKSSVDTGRTRQPFSKGSAFTRINKKGNEVHRFLL